MTFSRMKEELEMQKAETSQAATAIMPVHTSCKGCIFAVCNGKTQTGCAMERIDKYRKQGSVIEAFDEEEEFFVVNGTRCHAYRPKTWIGERGPSYLRSDVRKELTVKVDLIIHLGPEHAHPFDTTTINRTIKDIKAQTTPFHQVIFVNNGAFESGDLIAYLREWAQGIDWKMMHMFGEKPHENSHGFIVDHAQNNVKGGFYAVFNWGDRIPSSFVSDIDRAINDDLQRFVYLYPTTEGNGEVVQTRFHKHVGGNALTQTMKDGVPTGPVLSSVREKVDELKSQPEFNMQTMVRNVTEICPALN